MADRPYSLRSGATSGHLHPLRARTRPPSRRGETSSTRFAPRWLSIRARGWRASSSAIFRRAPTSIASPARSPSWTPFSVLRLLPRVRVRHSRGHAHGNPRGLAKDSRAYRCHRRARSPRMGAIVEADRRRVRSRIRGTTRRRKGPDDERDPPAGHAELGLHQSTLWTLIEHRHVRANAVAASLIGTHPDYGLGGGSDSSMA
jgi:hypothetical protein